MNIDLYNKYAEVPETAQKKITGGRLNGKTDINPMWRIKSLTEEFGECGFGWYYKVLNRWLEQGANGEVAGFVEIELFVKRDNEWSAPIYGVGGSMFVANEKQGAYTSDEVYKMATTDAISVACKQLGFGANVYWSADRTKCTKSAEEKPKEATKPIEIKPTAEHLAQAKELNVNLAKLAVYWKTTEDNLTDANVAYAINAKLQALELERKKTEAKNEQVQV